MGQNSNISWTHHTFNPWRGCVKVSEGCANCYAEAMSKRNPSVLGIWGPQGTRVVAAEPAWRDPILWNVEAARAGERHRVFCASLADVFEAWDGPVLDSRSRRLHLAPSRKWCPEGLGSPVGEEGWCPLTMDDVRRRLFETINATPCLDWLLLTKRPENISPTLARLREMNLVSSAHFPWANVWLGVTAENQEHADKRIPELLKVPAVVRFLSCEPLLSPVDLRLCPHPEDKIACLRDQGEDSPCACVPCSTGRHWINGFAHDYYPTPRYPDVPARHCGLDWVIVGGESGPKRRPCDVAWIRSLADQCQAAGVPVFVKQDAAPLPGSQGRIPVDLWSLKQVPATAAVQS